ncbi:MAG TPA: acyloxyacyl hydrolase, partial [Verrucomicrobiae bacterium]|nr:acyloxyacyl hydrolase [Verrucomicrobiae bacterium]
DVGGGGLFRGNFEMAPEFFGSGIFEGTGTYIVGGTLWFRYNFVPRESRLVPYAQVGGGWVFMDIDHRYDGENFNFNLDAAVGLRYFLKPRLSVNLEYRVQHISNANLWQHNLGLNSQGPVLGVSWLF